MLGRSAITSASLFLVLRKDRQAAISFRVVIDHRERVAFREWEAGLGRLVQERGGHIL
jgi:hypothetical protein